MAKPKVKSTLNQTANYVRVFMNSVESVCKTTTIC